MPVAAARMGLRKVRQRYGTDTFSGAVASLGGRQTTTGLMRWEDYSGQGVFGGGSWHTTGTGEVRATPTTGPADGDSASVVDTGYCDGWLQVQLLDGQPGYGGILFRLTNGNNWWQAYTNGAFLILTRYVAGTPTQVWSTPVATAYGDALAVHLDGLNISVYLNGTLQTTVSDGFNNTATRHGVWSTTYHLSARVSAVGLGSWSFSPTAPTAPTTPAVTFRSQGYNNNATPAASQSVSLASAVNETDIAILIAFEFPASQSITAVSGLGGIWRQALRTTNGSGNMGYSIWIGTNLTAGGTTVTATSSGNQTNELNVSAWGGIAGAYFTSAFSAGVVQTATGTGTLNVTVGRLVIGGVEYNHAETPTWTDVPAAWTDLTGSSDFFPAYRIVTATGNHSRSYTLPGAANFIGIAAEIR